MYASYKMQILPKNGSPLSSLYTYSFAKLNHTGEALHKASVKVLSTGTCCSAAKAAPQAVDNCVCL